MGKISKELRDVIYRKRVGDRPQATPNDKDNSFLDDISYRIDCYGPLKVIHHTKFMDDGISPPEDYSAITLTFANGMQMTTSHYLPGNLNLVLSFEGVASVYEHYVYETRRECYLIDGKDD